MAVTKQTYTATATWTAAQLATLFQNAFVDAGLMASWHDSFLNTIENRVLSVVYDAGKTYGTTYYWFQFTTSGVFLHTALSWSAASDIPSGTQYLDYFSTTTNATTNHRQLVSLAATTTVTLTRYTSGVNSACTWFVLRNGTTNFTFFIPPAGFGPSAFIDLNKTAFNGAINTQISTNSSSSSLEIVHMPGHTRRTFLGSEGLRGSTTSSHYIFAPLLYRYNAFGNTNNSGSSNIPVLAGTLGVWLPTASANTNTSLASDHTPVFSGPTLSPYLANMPSDFGVASYYSSNAMAIQDTLVVTAGTEEWEMITVGSNSSTDAGRILLLARTV